MEKYTSDVNIDDQNLIDEIAKNEHIVELGLGKELIAKNLIPILNYLDNNKMCFNCKSIDGCNHNPKGYSTKLTLDNGVISEYISPCRVGVSYVNNINKIVYSTYNAEDIINEKYVAYFKTFYKENAAIFSTNTKERMLSILKGESNSGLFLTITNPQARNNAILCLSNILIKSHDSICLIKMADFIKDVILEYNKVDDELLKKVMTSSCLLIDDLGNERISSVSRDEILLSILDYRRLNNLQTIITSMYKIEDFKSIYALKAQDTIKANLISDKIKEIEF